MRDKSIWNILTFLTVLVMIGVIPPVGAVSESDGNSSSATIYVPDDYPTIQAAVDAASYGDTIIVRDGTYNENINVEKRLTIKSENGTGNCIVHAAKSSDSAFEVMGDYVGISGFSVDGVSNYEKAGIFLGYANYCDISNNTCANNGDGIFISFSNGNNISLNNCSNTKYDGIQLWASNSNKLTGNIMCENGIVIGGNFLSNYTQEIDESNTVNGKPVYYWKNAECGRIPEGAGQVILANCTNVTIENQDLNNASIGIQLAFSSFSTIINNDCSDNYDGICLRYSNNNSISKNNCYSNIAAGIELEYSSSNNLSNNNCSNNSYNIRLEDSNKNGIANNNCPNSMYGVFFYKSNNNSLANNNCSNGSIRLEYSSKNSISNNKCSNKWCGIHLKRSSNNKLTRNSMSESGIAIEGESLIEYTHEIDESNTVNGKPVYYWKNAECGRIPEGAGQIILANCTNATIENQNLNNGSIGMLIVFSSGITLKNNTCSNNLVGILLAYSNNNCITTNNNSNNLAGIHLWHSSYNRITKNICTKCWMAAISLFHSCNNQITTNNCTKNICACIYLRYSNNNSIYLNNFMNNTDSVDSYESTNTWNSTKEITYTYNGNNHTNFLGNYWDDYAGNDTNKDGIGDTFYIRDGDRDYPPLMQPWQNYFPEGNARKNQND